MPKGFTEKEKVFIRQKLIDAGKDIFGKYGFKKASIDEAVAAAGISKGAFYLFFDSKELYFMEVLETVEREFKGGMLEAVKDSSMPPKKRFKYYMERSMEYLERNPIMTKLKHKDLESLMLNLPPERIKEHMDGDLNFMVQFTEAFTGSSGMPNGVSQEALAGFFEFFFYIFINKDEIGEQKYKAGLELMLDMAGEYLFGRS